MLFLFPFGFCAMFSFMFLTRWLDIVTLRWLCFTILLTELLLTSYIFICISVTGFTSYVCLTQGISGASNFHLVLAFTIDELSCHFLIILLLALILCFAFLSEYFEYDLCGIYIMSLSAIFSQFAFIFFCSYDLLSALVFWEWISIVSFFLVKHWSMRVTTIKAGLKVFTISQFGDLFFIVGVTSILSVIGSSDMAIIKTQVITFVSTGISVMFCTVLIPVIELWSISLVIALLLKSAQVVFFPWLLDAMEAPVPISAQLHSSTLVIIGFYIVLRLWDLIILSRYSCILLGVSGLLTAVSASCLGFYQEDGKRLLACSTAGQLGYVICAMSVNLVDEALILLTFCCCNKAYIFVWLGTIMEKSNGISDFRLLSCTRLLTYERAGLLTATLNSTVAPGAFAWHVKSLLSRGVLTGEALYCKCALSLLGITWFLSSCYLLRLLFYVSLPSNVKGSSLNSFMLTTTRRVSLYSDLIRTKRISSIILFLTQLMVLLALMGFGIFVSFSTSSGNFLNSSYFI